jgi:hypothetical protein
MAGQALAITVTFSEAITSTGTSSLLMETGMVDTPATCAAVTASTALSCIYTVAEGDTSARLDYQSTSALTGTIADTAGNVATLALPELRASGLYLDQTIVIDTTAPELDGPVTFREAQSGTGPFNSGASVTMNVTSSESLSAAPVVTFSGAELPTVTLTGSDTSWTGSVGNLTGDGAVTYVMVLTDVAGTSRRPFRQARSRWTTQAPQ